MVKPPITNTTDPLLAFLLIVAGVLATTHFLYQLLLAQGNLEHGLSYLLFLFFRFTPWSWLLICMIWSSLALLLLPKTRITTVGSANFCATAALALWFHMPSIGPPLLIGMLSLALAFGIKKVLP